jgi:hypothetical protein
MKFGGLKLHQVKRLKELERENARLRKAVSGLTLEKVILKEAAVAAETRQAAAGGRLMHPTTTGAGEPCLGLRLCRGSDT